MKRFLLSGATVLVVALLFGACKKSDNNNSTTTNNNGNNTPSMTAKVNGNAFTAKAVNANTSTSNGITILYINGADASGNTIMLELFGDSVKPGTYTTDQTNAAAMYMTANNTQSYANHDGQFVITSYSNKVAKGTFNFTTTDSTQITDGNFTVTLP